MTQGPDPRAAVRGFMALVLDMVRVDPERRPSAEMQRWHRELLDGALRLSRILEGGPAASEAVATDVARALG